MAANGYWHRVQRTRISRRRLLKAAGAGTAGLAVIAATGGGVTLAAPGGRPAAGGVPLRGGRFRFALTREFDSLDPVTGFGSGPTIFPRMYNTLVAVSARQTDFVFFDLAETLEQPDGETYLYSIRQGVLIAPNDLGIPERELDALDASRWLDRVTQDPIAWHRPLTDQWLQSYDAPDSQTFRIRTNGPYAYFLLRLGTPLGGTIPPREFFDGGISLQNQGVGAGPFFLRPGTFQHVGGASLDRNPNYYRSDPVTGAQLPYLDGIDIVRIDDRSARRAAFISQEIHTYGAEDAQDADELLSQYDVFDVPEPVNTFISFGMNVKRPPWDNPNVRKAAMHALNRQEYIDLVYGGDAMANGLVHWPLTSFALPEEELEQLQPFDPQRSRQLIQEAGFDLPLEIKVMFPASLSIQQHEQHLPIWLVQMEEAGFRVNQEPLDFGTWLDRYINKDYDASLAPNQIHETPEVPLDYQHSSGPAGDNTFSNGLQDPEVDATIDATRAITNPEELAEAVRGVQRLIYERGPAFLPIVSPFDRTLYWSFVTNVPQGLGPVGLYLSDLALGTGPAPTATPELTPAAAATTAATSAAAATPGISLPGTGAEGGSDGLSWLAPALAGGWAGAGVIALAAAALRLRMRRP